MKSLLFVALSLLAVPVMAQKKIKMVVHEEPKDCRRMMEQTCLQVQIDGSKEWTLFYDEIRGFEYEPGYRYEIIVIETPRPEPVPQDLSRNTYALSKVVSKTQAVTSGNVSSPMWKVVSVNGLQMNSDNIYFDFIEDSTKLAGKSGCNQFSVPVTFNSSKTKLKTGTAVSTEMACSEEIMKQEANFLSNLQNRKFKLKKKDNQVHFTKGLFSKNVFVTEQFTPAKPGIISDSPWDKFDGKTMKVIQLNGKNFKESKAEIVFDSANGRFSGNNGCNQINGGFSAEGTAIMFSKVVSTKMACVDENMRNTEKEMMAVLNSPGLSYDVAEVVINIYDGSGKLVMMLAK